MISPRVVLDTNILVSSLWGGVPRKLIHLWEKGLLRVLMTHFILEEYLAVLSRFDPPQEDRDILVALLGHQGRTEWVTPSIRLNIIPEDPPDNRFLECAFTGMADALVSGDRHLLKLKQYERVPILPPAAFLHKWFPKR